MREKAPFIPYRTLHSEARLTDYLYAALKECELPEETINELMQMHYNDPDGFDDNVRKDEPHPLYLLSEAEKAGRAEEFWSDYRAKNKKTCNENGK